MAIRRLLPVLKQRHSLDLVIVNGENAAGGSGIDAATYREIRDAGADCVTLGDHAFHRKSASDLLSKEGERCIRPANFPEGAPGVGWTVVKSTNGVSVGVCNILGRVFMGLNVDCPFRAFDALRSGPLKECAVVVVDFHAEATSEKIVFGKYADGRASIVFGTHTHVETADEQILPAGTAYVTDIGMCGSRAGVIGMRYDLALRRLREALPASYEAAEGAEQVTGILVTVDPSTGRSQEIQRLRESLASETAS
jgi:2',3'-cyclic-nucleotide 2'-phosphodiesterase